MEKKTKDFKSIISNTGAQLLVKVFASSTTFIVTVALAYFLGLNIFGSFTKVIAFISLFYLFIDFGINSIFLKKYFENVEKLFFNVLILRLILSFIIFVAVTLLSFYLPYNKILETGFSPQEKIGIIIFSLTFFTQAIIFSINSLLQKNLSYKYLVLPNFVQSILILIFLFFSIQFKNLNLMFLGYFISGIFFCLTFYFFHSQSFKINIQFFSFNKFSKDIFLSSVPLGLMLIFNLIYFKADTLILSFYRTGIEVGIYGFAYKIFEFLITIPTFLSNSIYPILLGKQDQTLSLLKRYSILLLFSSLIISFATYILSPYITCIKSDFLEAVLPLRILSISLPIFFLTSLFQWIFIIKNQIKILVMIYFTGMLINIFLNIIFIPAYSYVASSYITVFSEALVFLLMILYFVLQKEKIFRNENGK